MINPQKAVEWYKQRFNTEGLSDYDIYESVKQLHPDLDYMDNPFGVKQELQIPTLKEAEENTNPSFFENSMVLDWDVIYSMEKAKKFGFTEEEEPSQLFIDLFNNLKERKVIPSA